LFATTIYPPDNSKLIGFEARKNLRQSWPL
jgi:hypothetical protein